MYLLTIRRYVQCRGFVPAPSLGVRCGKRKEGESLMIEDMLKERSDNEELFYKIID